MKKLIRLAQLCLVLVSLIILISVQASSVRAGSVSCGSQSHDCGNNCNGSCIDPPDGNGNWYYCDPQCPSGYDHGSCPDGATCESATTSCNGCGNSKTCYKVTQQCQGWSVTCCNGSDSLSCAPGTFSSYDHWANEACSNKGGRDNCGGGTQPGSCGQGCENGCQSGLQCDNGTCKVSECVGKDCTCGYNPPPSCGQGCGGGCGDGLSCDNGTCKISECVGKACTCTPPPEDKGRVEGWLYCENSGEAASATVDIVSETDHLKGQEVTGGYSMEFTYRGQGNYAVRTNNPLLWPMPGANYDPNACLGPYEMCAWGNIINQTKQGFDFRVPQVAPPTSAGYDNLPACLAEGETADVGIKWNTSEGASWYDVRVDRNAPSELDIILDQHPSTNYTIEDVPPGETVAWWVHSRRNICPNAWSPPLYDSFTIPACQIACNDSVPGNTTVTVEGITKDLTITSSVKNGNMRKAIWFVYNRDNLDANGIPQPYKPASTMIHLTRTVDNVNAPSATVTFTREELSQPDSNHGNRRPTNLQVNVWFYGQNGEEVRSHIDCLTYAAVEYPPPPPTYTVSGRVYFDDGQEVVGGDQSYCSDASPSNPRQVGKVRLTGRFIEEGVTYKEVQPDANGFYSIPGVLASEVGQNYGLQLTQLGTDYSCECLVRGGTECGYSIKVDGNEQFDFFVKDREAKSWWQVWGGLVHSNQGGLVSILPQAIFSFLNGSVGVTPGGSTTAGIPTSAGIIDIGSMAGVTYSQNLNMRVTNHSHSLVYNQNYQYFANKIDKPSSRNIPDILTSKPSASGVVVNGDTHVYFAPGNQIVDAGAPPWSVNAGEKLIIFVDGNLTFRDFDASTQQLYTVADGGFIAFIVSGSITIDDSVGYDSSANAPATTQVTGRRQGNIAGVFIADKQILIEGDGDTTKVDKKFIGEGSFVSWGQQAGLEAIRFDRNFDITTLPTSLNINDPTESFIFRPDFILSLPEAMKETGYQWQEVN